MEQVIQELENKIHKLSDIYANEDWILKIQYDIFNKLFDTFAKKWVYFLMRRQNASWEKQNYLFAWDESYFETWFWMFDKKLVPYNQNFTIPINLVFFKNGTFSIGTTLQSTREEVKYFENKILKAIHEKIPSFVETWKNYETLAKKEEWRIGYSTEKMSDFSKIEQYVTLISEVLSEIDWAEPVGKDFFVPMADKRIWYISEKSLNTVQTKEELIDNINAFHDTLINGTQEDKDYLKGLIRRGTNFIMYQIDGKDYFAPSRYIWYKNATIARHKVEKWGWWTTDNAINKILWEKQENNEIWLKYQEYCNDNTLSYRKFWLLDGVINPMKTSQPKYWLYAPWQNASKWDEFYSKWIMAIQWDELWNLEQYPDSEKIKEKLIEITGKANPYNDVLACEDFVRNIKIWDIIIPKQWTKNYLWYWIVEWDYEFDDNLEEYKSIRKVKWMKKWVWEEIEWPIVLKTLTDITKYTDYVERLKTLLWINTTHNTINTPQMDTTSRLLTSKKQIILYWPPGTGKTYNIKTLIENHSWEEYADLQNVGRVEFITFHQSFSYEEFIEGIKPDLSWDSSEISYKIEDGIFKRIVNKAKQKEIRNFTEAYKTLLEKIEDTSEWMLVLQTKTWKEFWVSINSNENLNLLTGKDKKQQWTLTKENIRAELESDAQVFEYWGGYFQWVKKYLENECWYRTIEELTTPKNYYLVIDEINRWNISKIFGELITLLEADKRLWEENEVITKLPYSKEDFWIPSNLFIVATMNTSDKSIVSLDTALRRRFWFVEMLPDYTLEWLQREIEGINLSDLLQKINNRIEYLIDKDHLIGHSYFLKIKNIEDLKSAIYNEIVPLLEEYFYGEEEKIMQVLWSRLFVKKSTANDLFEKKAQIDITSDEQQYVINKDMTFDDFIAAIKNIIIVHEEA